MLFPKDILGATNYYFPDNYGVLITGSQRNNIEFKRESDIDIVVFDMLTSCVWNKSAERDGYKIDFTVIPVTDIENALSNNINEPKNGLLSMLATSNILSDPYKFVEDVIEKAKEYCNKIQFKSEEAYAKYLIELRKLRKLFSNQVSEIERIILLSDFVTIASDLEIIKLTNWQLKTKHKLKFLNDESPAFLKEMSELFKKGCDNKFDDIINYIDFRKNEMFNNFSLRNNKYNRLVIDIGYKNFSISYFVNKVLPIIIEENIISEAYLYFYLSPLKYNRKYKNNISIVFEINNDNIFSLLQCIEKKIYSLSNQQLIYNYFLEYSEHESFYLWIKKIKIELNKIIHTQINQSLDFEPAKAIDIFTKLVFFLKAKLKIDNKEFEKINSLIAQKWLFTREEQYTASNHKALLKLSIEKLRKADLFYKNRLPSLMKLLVEQDYENLGSNLGLNNIFKIINNGINDFKVVNDISRQLLSACNFDMVDNLWFYKLIVEEIILILNVKDIEKVMVLYSTAKAVKEANIPLN